MDSGGVSQFAPDFNFLIDEMGSQVIKSDLSPSFGNALVILRTRGLTVTLTRDRGDISVRVGRSSSVSDSEDLNLIRNDLCGLNLLTDASTPELAAFLKSHMDDIEQLFAPPMIAQTMQRCKDLAQDRLRQMFPGAIQD